MGAPWSLPAGDFRLRRIDTDEFQLGASTILLDLAALNNGAAYGFGMKNDLKGPGGPLDVQKLSQRGHHGVLADQGWRPDVTWETSLVVNAPDEPTMRGFARTLLQYMHAPGVWEWRPVGLSQSVYLDALPSGIESFYAGQPLSLHFVMSKLIVPDGFKFVLGTQPWSRDPLVANALAAHTLDNRVGHRVVAVSNAGNTPSLMIWRFAPQQTNAQLVRIRGGRKSSGNLTEHASSFVDFECESGTLSNGTAPASVPHASGGNVARTTYAAADTLKTRVRLSGTPVDVSALIGSYRVYVVVTPSAGIHHTLAGRYAIADDGTPAGLTLQGAGAGTSRPIDGTVLTAGASTAIFLGIATFPSITTDFVLELLSAADGAGTLDWDDVFLLPAEQFYDIGETSFLAPDPQDVYPASAPAGTAQMGTPAGCTGNGGLDAAGEEERTLDQYQGLAPLPLGGQIYPAGLNIVTGTLSVRDGDKTLGLMGELRVRLGAASVAAWQATHVYTVGTIIKPTGVARPLRGRTFRCTGAGTSGGTEPVWLATYSATPVTDGGATWVDTQVASIPLNAIPGQLWTDLSPSLIFASDGTSQYEFLYVQVVVATGARSLHVAQIGHLFMKTISSPGVVVLDGRHFNGRERTAYVDSAGAHAIEAIAFVESPPGPANYVWDFVSAPVPGMDQVDPLEPLGTSIVEDGAGVLLQYVVSADQIVRNGPE